jgi:hypothetical protein
MTLPDERTSAVLRTREFLLKLMSAHNGFKRIPKAVRIEARRLLKHFPHEVDMTRPGETFGAHRIRREEH